VLGLESLAMSRSFLRPSERKYRRRVVLWLRVERGRRWSGTTWLKGGMKAKTGRAGISCSMTAYAVENKGRTRW
jgi:hypothetical protein